MDITGFLNGRFLKHPDLPAPSQVWTVRQVAQQIIQGETKICVRFDQHEKWLPLNMTNLNAIAIPYGVQSENWIGRPLEVYRDKTSFKDVPQDCVRVRVPQLPTQASQTPVAYQPPQGPSQFVGAYGQPGVTPAGQPPQQSAQPGRAPSAPVVPWAQ